MKKLTLLMVLFAFLCMSFPVSGQTVKPAEKAQVVKVEKRSVKKANKAKKTKKAKAVKPVVSKEAKK